MMGLKPLRFGVSVRSVTRPSKRKRWLKKILHVRQEAAQARFLASLAETQLQWLKQEARQRVDAQPSARFLASRYPLYKTEEEQLIHEWMGPRRLWRKRSSYHA